MYDLEALGIDLYKTSSFSDEYKTKCLWHDDSSPSMFINRRSGLAWCFSCAAKANMVQICEKLNISLIEHDTDYEIRVKLKEENWKDLLNAKIDTENNYLTKTRHLLPETIEKFQIRSFDGGVFIPNYSLKGVCTGGQIRFYEGFTRYKKIGEGEIYPVKNLCNSVVLVEGAFGVFNLWQQGIKAVTGYGAQALVNNKNWLLTLQRLNAKILFDDDNAGYSAAAQMMRNAPFLETYVRGCEADEIVITPEELKEWPTVKSVAELERWLKYRA